MTLSSPLPLRTTASWLLYREAAVIPHRYGQTGGKLLQYDDGLRLWVWADHPVQSIDSVQVSGQTVGNWVWRNGPDYSGRVVAFVEFSEPVDEGLIPTARGRGKLDPDAGGLLTNPAALVLDILTLAGSSITRSDLTAFRIETADIVIAGTLDDTERSAQSIIRDVCDSVGAAFTPDASGVAFLWPGGSSGSTLATIKRGHSVTANCNASAIVNDLTLRFDFEEGQPRKTVQLEVPASIARIGRQPRVLDAMWLRENRHAVAVATRLLQHRARPVWQVSASGIQRVLKVGHAVTLDHPVLPIAGNFRILGRTVNLETRESEVFIEVPAGPVPSVSLIRQSSQIEPQQYAAATIVTVGDQRVVTIYDSDGRTPLAGAQVTLVVANVTRTSDGSGRVEFPVALMPPGNYVLDILSADGRTMTMAVTV